MGVSSVLDSLAGHNDLEGFKNATWILDDGTLPCRQRDQGHQGYLGWCFETVDLVKLAEAISNSAEPAETLTRLEYETEMVIAFYGNDLEAFKMRSGWTMKRRHSLVTFAAEADLDFPLKILSRCQLGLCNL